MDGGNLGAYSSIALDSAGHPHISYYDEDYGDLKYAYYDGSGWRIETVDSAGDVGRHTSIAVDATDLPRISYYDYGGNDLRYAYHDGQDWRIETVDSIGGEFSSLALSAGDLPHISYYDPASDALKYAYHDGQGWQIELVEIIGEYSFVYSSTSIAVDAAGHPHIGYINGNFSDLRYAYWDGSTWQIEVVDSAGMVGQYTSVAVDSAGHPHISYCHIGGGDLKYAHHDGTAWIIRTLDGEGYVGASTSIALDSGDRPHIGYYDSTNGDLKYAYYDGSTWQIEIVDSAGYVGGYTSLALDANDLPHLSYYDATNDDLKYAYHGGSGSAGAHGRSFGTASGAGLDQGWQIETVDSAGDVGRHTSLALDALGRPHISYYKVSNSSLKYAYHDGSTWQIEEVDNSADVGEYTSLSLDPSDRPHISYYDATLDDLKYAYYDGLAWQIETVDSAGDVGYYTSLALGPTGFAHISYFNNSGFNLKFAYYDGLAWQIGTVDYAQSVGMYTALALDPTGRPHISYHDGLNGSLKYAYLTCLPVSAVDIAGPVMLRSDETGLYTATLLPPNATPPAPINWDNGTVGPTAVYSWTQPGTYVITADSANACGSGSGNLTVHVCQPLEEVQVEGPTSPRPGEVTVYTATITPITATTPLTITWDNGTVGPTAAYSWTQPGSYTLTVTGTNDCSTVSGSLAVQVCQPVLDVPVQGPADLGVGETAVFSASFAPITATTPVTITWDNGTVGPTAVYSWTVAGTYGLAVTATNACGQGHGALSVTVFCQEMSAVLISGPVLLPVGWEGTYQAEAAPITASLPITYTWSDGTVGPTAVYSWTQPGTYTLAVTASNPCGVMRGDLLVEVATVSYEIYLPLLYR